MKGHYEAAKKVMPVCSLFTKYAYVRGIVDFNKAAGLSGELSAPETESHFAAIIEPAPSELRLAKWDEIDWDEAVRTRPRTGII